MNYDRLDISALTIAQIRDLALNCDNLKSLINVLRNDERLGVVSIRKSLERKLSSDISKKEHSKSLYDFQSKISGVPSSLILGLDEVGRGPLAGPLVVGGVILDESDYILGLNDSKKLSSKLRDKLSSIIKNKAIYYRVEFVSPDYIDKYGLTKALIFGFKKIISNIENYGLVPNTILLDGYPLHLDCREINVIKGDGKCASIAAASIIAKVDRDDYMCRVSKLYPQYGFEQNKGYGTSMHIEALKKHGPCEIHRKSFIRSFNQISFIK